MSIDKKLKELLSDDGQLVHCCGQAGTSDIEKGIAQIKQVFLDEGWEQPRPLTDNEVRAINDYTKANHMMTGQEWYDRFKKEVEVDFDFTGVGKRELADTIVNHISEAAKKASGLTLASRCSKL